MSIRVGIGNLPIGGGGESWSSYWTTHLFNEDDLTFHAKSRNALSLVDDLGDNREILSPTFISVSSGYLRGDKTRACEKLFDGNSYTIYFKFKIISAGDGYLIDLGNSTTNKRGISWFLSGTNMWGFYSDGATYINPNTLANAPALLSAGGWCEMFIEIDFDLKQIRVKYFGENASQIGSTATSSIAAYVFNNNDNEVFFKYSSASITAYNFKKFAGLKTISQCRDDSYNTGVQMFIPDMVTGIDVSGNGNHMLPSTWVNKYYSGKNEYLLKYGYSKFVLAGSNDINVPLLMDGTNAVATLPTVGGFNNNGQNWIRERDVSGNISKHNLADSYIDFDDAIWDRSDETIYAAEARLNYYVAANPKRWHISELNRLIMNDYLNVDYKGRPFVKMSENSFKDRNYLDEVFVYANNVSGQDFRKVLQYCGDIATENYIYLKTPYTQVIRVTADDDSEFTININKGLHYKNKDFMDEINLLPTIQGEDLLSRVYRYFLSVSTVGPSLAAAIHRYPIFNNNSYNRPECSGLSSWMTNIMSNYVNTSTLRIFRHPADYAWGTVSAFVLAVYRMLFYKDVYTLASLEEVQADLKLASEPARRTNPSKPASYANSVNLIPDYVREASYEVYTGSLQYTCKLPNTAIMLMPVKSTNQPKCRGGAEDITKYANAIVTVPTGITGIVDMPLGVCRVSGTGSVKISDVTYALPADAAALLTELEKYVKFNHEVEILTNTGGITIEYLLNNARCLLTNNNLIDRTVISGAITVDKVTTALIVPTFKLNIQSDDIYTFNHYQYNNKSSSFFMPMMADDSSLTRVVTFYPKAGETKRSQPYQDVYLDVLNEVRKITAGVRVIDECWASKLMPRDDSFAVSIELSFSHLDDSKVYYTTNGDTPTTSSTEYTAPFTISETTTIKWINAKADYVDSYVNSRTITKS